MPLLEVKIGRWNGRFMAKSSALWGIRIDDLPRCVSKNYCSFSAYCVNRYPYIRGGNCQSNRCFMTASSGLGVHRH